MALDQLEDLYELSPLQQGFLFHTLYDPATRAYFEQFAWSIGGALDVAAFARAWQHAVDQHAILRSSFHWHDLEQPVQAVHRAVELPIERLDWRALPAEAQRVELSRLLQADRERGFELEQPPLLRLTLAQTAVERWYLVWSYHHLLLDGWSMSIVLRDVFRAYAALVERRALPSVTARPYGDYIAWLQQQDHAAAERFWRRTLQGFSAPTPLVVGQPAASVDPDQRYQERRLALSAATTAALQTLARQQQITLSTIFQAAWALLLSRLSGAQDVVFGATVAGRPAELLGFDTMVGLFINTLPVRVELPPDQPVISWLQQLQQQQFALHQYEWSPLVEVQRWSQLPPGQALFESIVVFENYPLDRALPELSRGLEIENVSSVQRSGYPLTVMAIPAAELLLRITYDVQRFDAATIERMLGQLQTILSSIAERPEQPLGRVTLLSAAEQQRLLAWHSHTASYPTDQPIHALLAEQAARTPEATALICGDERLSYRELDQRANQLAHALRALDVAGHPQAEQPVAICLHRSAALIVALLGTFKAGGVCLPLDPSHPPERLQFMLDDARPSVLLTEQALEQLLPQPPARMLCLDRDWPMIARHPASAPDVSVGGAQLAYLIYTSGTSGQPKAVMVEHRQLVNTLLAGQATFGLTPGTVLPCLASFSFDIAFFELLSPLLLGGTSLLLSREQALEQPALARALRASTALHSLPSLMRAIISYARSQGQRYEQMRQVFVGGDRVPPDLVREMQAIFPGAQVLIAYGPTEAAIICAAYPVPRDQPATLGTQHLIGRPLANVILRIYDPQQRLMPAGVPGELYIGGAAVTRGYLNRPELTAEKFVTIDGQRFYRSGDLARHQPDGTLEFLGRIDEQVKVRGYRIELQEIEALLAQQPQVEAAAVVARPDAAGEAQLVAYVVAEERRTENREPRTENGEQRAENGEWRAENGERRTKDQEPGVEQGNKGTSEHSNRPSALRQELARRLPEYMLPSAFVLLPELPLTVNGKVDRRALALRPLPSEPSHGAGAAQLAPRSTIERQIAQVWQEVLQLEQVGVDDNFFELGGHSIRMIQVQGKLRELLDREIAMVDLFRYPTIATLAEFLSAAAEAEPSAAPEPQRPTLRELAPLAETDIAIVGMSGRFPGAPDVETFWQNLRDGRESIRFFSDDELRAAGIPEAVFSHPEYVKAGAVLDGIELFDAGFFGYSPREAAIMDPQQRIFLECAWQALERAGYNPDSYSGRIGVYAGVSTNSYLLHNLAANREALESFGGFQTMILNEKDHLTTRVSYKLNLRGPSINLQTACSTSLVAAVVACQNLLLHQCDMALAGGVSINVPHTAGYRYQQGGIVSPDGHCRAFDASAQGTITGNGAGVVVLKRLADAVRDGDQIHALIRGFALNNDGAQKVGYTAPGVDGQAEVIGDALALAGIDPATIDYVETHGTGTPLGDPIEIAALSRAFGRQQPATVAIGSVKSNIGHLDAAAGVAGLIKAALSLEQRQLPPSLHVAQPNPLIDWAGTPFYVNTQLQPWPEHDRPRRAGVSAFGIGGTNAHVVLEAAPPAPDPGPSRAWQVLPLSARSAAALEQATHNLIEHLRAHPQQNLADVAYTLQVGRKSFAHRRLLVCHDRDDALATLETADPERMLGSVQQRQDRPVAFLLPGQGAQYVSMAQDLYRDEPVFRASVDRCAELLTPTLGLDLRDVLYPPAERSAAATQQLRQTGLTQPALFVIEYALAQLWQSWGLRPRALLGHSLGEYVAATLAGVFMLPDALQLVALRGQLMEALPPGAMLSVALPAAELEPLLGPQLTLAAINGPRLCVAAGPAQAVDALERDLRERGVDCQRLHTSHAFHSAMMEPIMAPLAAFLRTITLRPPQLPYLSNVTGGWITAEQATDPDYWTRHLRQPVRFDDNLRTLLGQPSAAAEPAELLLLEVGPGRSLGTLARQQQPSPAVLSSLRHPHDEQSDVAFLLRTLGQLWLLGAQLDWSCFSADERRRRVLLPTYPFERQRYWIEAQPAAATSAADPAAPPAPPLTLHARPELLNPFVAPRTTIEQRIAEAWQELLGIAPIGVHDNFFDLGGHSLMATQIIARLRDVFPVELPVRELFDAATIAELATLIEARLIEKLDDLTDDEAQLLL